MMFFRNPEIRRSVWLWAAAAVVLTAAACLMGWQAGIGTLTACLVLIALHFAVTRRRYDRIADLSREIDRVLHGGGRAELERFREGELAILQNELQKMTVRLQQQNEALTREKGYLADAMADLSHQIRTPLTSLRLVASLLSEENLPEERRLELVRELHGLLGRMDWLIETLLKLSRLDAGTVQMASEPVPVSQLISMAAGPLAVPMELRDQRLTVQVGEETYEGDLHWSVEALGNVLKNCMEHTPEGGEIRVRAKKTPIFTEIVVSDNGPGIDREDLPHLFERFYKGKNASASSVGIGLALAHRIVAEQNGTLSAGNGRHGGAEFTLRFYHRTV